MEILNLFVSFTLMATLLIAAHEALSEPSESVCGEHCIPHYNSSIR